MRITSEKFQNPEIVTRLRVVIASLRVVIKLETQRVRNFKNKIGQIFGMVAV